MLVGAVVCPHPPAIVPAVSQGAAAELAELRTACCDAVAALSAADHDLLVCVGAGPRTTSWGAEAGGSLRAFGVDVTFGGDQLVLPPALTVGCFLLEDAGLPAPGRFQAVSSRATPDECAALGATLAAAADRVAMLVMGDGSAKRTTTAPGYLDVRAASFDSHVVRALSEPDPASLRAIDPELADDLWVAGRPAWHVLAGALEASGEAWSSRVDYDEAPLGVGYFVVRLTAV